MSVEKITEKEIAEATIDETIENFFEERLNDEKFEKVYKELKQVNKFDTTIEDLAMWYNENVNNKDADPALVDMVEDVIELAKLVGVETGKEMFFDARDKDALKLVLKKAYEEQKAGKLNDEDLDVTIEMIVNYCLFISTAKPVASEIELDEIVENVLMFIMQGNENNLQFLNKVFA